MACLSFCVCLVSIKGMQCLTWELMPGIETLRSLHSCHPTGHTDHTWLQVCGWEERSFSNVSWSLQVLKAHCFRFSLKKGACNQNVQSHIIGKAVPTVVLWQKYSFFVTCSVLILFCQCVGNFAMILNQFYPDFHVSMHPKHPSSIIKHILHLQCA